MISLTPKTSPTPDHMRHRQQFLYPVLVVGVCLSGCAWPGSSTFTDGLFAQYELAIGSAPHQTILTGFLLDGPLADLAVVHVDEEGERRLQIYSCDEGTWGPSRDIKLHREVLFVDIASIGGKDRLIS